MLIRTREEALSSQREDGGTGTSQSVDFPRKTRSDEVWRAAESHHRTRLKGETVLATFALIHGAGDSAWFWHLVEPELRMRATMS